MKSSNLRSLDRFVTGIDIREDKSCVTQDLSRFIPHIISD